MTNAKLVSVNLLAYVDQGEVGKRFLIESTATAIRTSRWVTVGSCWDSASATVSSATWATTRPRARGLVHPSDDARYAVVGLSCIGNRRHRSHR